MFKFIGHLNELWGIMKLLTIILLFTCTYSWGQECNEYVLIKKSEYIENQIKELFLKDDFYIPDSSQYYFYEITLNKNLETTNIKAVFSNNPNYNNSIKFLLQKLEFIGINRTDCESYQVPFIINARLKTITYPTKTDFYKIDLPIE